MGAPMSSDLDPDIANLLDDTLPPPDFSTLMGGGKPAPRQNSSLSVPVKDPQDPDATVSKQFPEVKVFEQNPVDYFTDKDYYKILLTGEGEAAQSLHANLAKYLKAATPEDKTAFRNRLVGQFWEVGRSISPKASLGSLHISKKMLLRFGVVLPTLINRDQRVMLGKVVDRNPYGVPFYYADEWLAGVARGEIAASATDEVAGPSRKKTDSKMKQFQEKARGAKDSAMMIIETKQADIMQMERRLADEVNCILQHNSHYQYPNLKEPYSDMQRRAMNNVMELIKELNKQDKDVSFSFQRLAEAIKDLQEIDAKISEMGEEASVDSAIITKEFDSLRQMAKMCIGRQGNHFPILMQQYCPSNIAAMATRENVIQCMDKIEKLDPDVFKRTFKQQTNRIIPYVIILPCYGDKGICWEPFDRFNRSTSRGRIAVPLYPKDTFMALLVAVADLRWQVAKEKAAHYWMEEGLTGHYYQWFTDSKQKGDVRLKFIEDYILWITKESEGVQKLDKDARGVFWRDIPFPQKTKEYLKNRGFVYAELFKKDINRSMSDGY
jgi:hypothetical protein